jgi:hypothetical protein
MDHLYKTRNAAEFLGMAAQTLKNLVSQGAFREDETWRENRTRRVFTEKGLQRFQDDRRKNGAKLGPLFPKKKKGRP